MKKIALVYFVAGISSRFNGKIKGLVKVKGNKTLIEYSLDQALKSDFSKIVFIVGNKTEKQFKKKFGKSYKKIPVFYAIQHFDEKIRNRPWGTVDALCSASSFLKTPFVICNGDDIYGENAFQILFNHLKKEKTEATIGYNLSEVLPQKGKVNRGIIKIKKNYVENIKDSFNITKENFKSKKLKPNDKCSMNIFSLHPKVLSYLKSDFKKFKEQNKGDRDIESRLPHEISKLISRKKIKLKVYSATDKWVGITNPGDEKKVREILKKK